MRSAVHKGVCKARDEIPVFPRLAEWSAKELVDWINRPDGVVLEVFGIPSYRSTKMLSMSVDVAGYHSFGFQPDAGQTGWQQVDAYSLSRANR